MLTDDARKSATEGATPSRIRDHNARAILTLLRSSGALAGSEIARALKVSAQTSSVILRALSEQGLIRKGDPVKGKVGKPQMPYALDPDGACAFGLRLGRRSTELVLMDFVGRVRGREEISYPFPRPAELEAFLARETARMCATVDPQRIAGIGIAAPFELWNWLDALGAPKDEADAWRGYDIAERVSAVTGLEAFVANDVNLACNAELTYGAGRDLRDFAYVYVGSFIGGAVVMNGQVYHGPSGNGGAFGSIPVGQAGQGADQLIHHASLYMLERMIAAKRGSPVNLRAAPRIFAEEQTLTDEWLSQSSTHLARGITAVVAVLDICDIIIDGAFPNATRDALVSLTRAALDRVDQQGLHSINLIAGTLGQDAGALGAAHEPLMRAHFLTANQFS